MVDLGPLHKHEVERDIVITDSSDYRTAPVRYKRVQVPVKKLVLREPKNKWHWVHLAAAVMNLLAVMKQAALGDPWVWAYVFATLCFLVTWLLQFEFKTTHVERLVRDD